MINEKFEHLINGYPQDLTSQEVVDFGVHCAGQNLSLDKIITISVFISLVSLLYSNRTKVTAMSFYNLLKSIRLAALIIVILFISLIKLKYTIVWQPLL